MPPSLKWGKVAKEIVIGFLFIQVTCDMWSTGSCVCLNKLLCCFKFSTFENLCSQELIMWHLQVLSASENWKAKTSIVLSFKQAH